MRTTAAFIVAIPLLVAVAPGAEPTTAPTVDLVAHATRSGLAISMPST